MNIKDHIKHIDGLRAIAVMCVLFMHLKFSLLSGGYIGVDVFFVISGFLITRLIVLEINQTGTFSFLGFYCRRILRILPALFFVLILSWFLAFLLFSPAHFKTFGGSVITAALSTSNFYFWNETGYFDLAAKFKPLLHTWTLGVEEQFYLIWPVLLLFVARMNKKYLPIFISVVFVLSLSLNFPFQKEHITALYYLMPFRMFEFCMGGIMVWVTNYKLKKNLLLEPLCLLGIIMIIYPAITYNANTVFPSYNALMPILGAALIIYAGQAKFFGKLLTNRISVGIGLISYSLYLIHWPLIVFYTYLTSADLPLIGKWIVVLVSMVFAIPMYFYIEQPCRKQYQKNRAVQVEIIKRWIIYTLLIVCLGGIVYFSKGWCWRVPKASRVLAENAEKYHRNNFGGAGFPYPGWIYGNTKDIPDVVVMGDSHSQMLDAGMYQEIAIPYNKKVYLSGASCLVLPNTTRVTPGTDWNSICPETLNNAMFELKKNPKSILILSESWVFQITNAANLDSKKRLNINLMSNHYQDYMPLIKKLDQLRALIGNRKLIIIGDVPGASLDDTKECLSRPFFKNFPCTKMLLAPIAKNAQAINVNKILSHYAESEKNTYFLNPYDALCSNGYCHSIDQNSFTYYSDGAHLSKVGSIFLIKSFQGQLLSIMNNK